jgi:hypothetical protein
LTRTADITLCRCCAPSGSTHTGLWDYANYYLSCTVETPLWINTSHPLTTLDGSVMVFPGSFTIRLNGTTYTRVALNRASLSLVFFPEGVDPVLYEREYTTPTFAVFTDDDLPLAWMKVSPSTGDNVRIVCIWCDQYDVRFGTIRWQMYPAPGGRVLRFIFSEMRHTSVFPGGTISAQVTLYESTGNIKVQYSERSVTNMRSGAVGLQLTTDVALDIDNRYLSYGATGSCPDEGSIVYTAGMLQW